MQDFVARYKAIDQQKVPRRQLTLLGNVGGWFAFQLFDIGVNSCQLDFIYFGIIACPFSDTALLHNSGHNLSISNCCFQIKTLGLWANTIYRLIWVAVSRKHIEAGWALFPVGFRDDWRQLWSCSSASISHTTNQACPHILSMAEMHVLWPVLTDAG